MANLPTPRIEVYSVFGKAGGFARNREKLWEARAIGVNGKEGQVPGSEWPSRSKEYPLTVARAYALFTGWPLVEIDDVGDRQPEPVRPWLEDEDR